MTVVVVGAGVSGLVSALTLARAGVPVTLLEEHDNVGTPCHCCGVVSTDYREKTGVSPPRSIELNDLHGFRFTDGTKQLVVRSERPVAKVISREKFDEHLSELCEARGVELLRSRRGVSIGLADNPTVVDDSARSRSSKYVVLAGGIADILSHQVGLGRDNSRLLISAQCLAKKRTDASIAPIYLNDNISPDFFGYVVPIDEEHCRIGVASKKVDVLRSVHLMAKKEGAELIGKPAMWGVWTGGPVSRTRRGNVFVVGDAAGMTKATTGGGIVFGALSARAVAETMIAELKGSPLDKMKSLDALVLQARKIRMMRGLMDLVGPNIIMDAMFSVTTSERLTQYMEGVDFDYHGGFTKILEVVRPSPSLLPLGVRALHHLLSGLFK